MNQTEQILGQLRDIQMPPAPDGISLWLVAANLGLLLFVVTVIILRGYRKKERWRREALKQVEHARTQEPAIAVLTLAKLLRQIMLYKQQDISTAGLPWLASLDELFDTRWFSQEEGQIFGAELYSQSKTTDAQLRNLCDQLDRLIRKLPAKTKSHDRLTTSQPAP